MMRAFFVIIAAAAGFAVAAQDSPSGAEQLRRFYAEVRDFHARFEQAVLDENLSRLEESAGVVWISRPGKFRWDYEQPAAQQVVSNGVKLWVYDPDLAQVTVRNSGDAVGETPAFLLAGGGDLEARYRVQDLGVQGALAWVALSPKSPRSNYREIRIGFDAGELRVLELVDGLDQTTRMTFFAPADGGAGGDDSRFEFTPPPGVDVLDESG